jgi:hypothetical protein
MVKYLAEVAHIDGLSASLADMKVLCLVGRIVPNALARYFARFNARRYGTDHCLVFIFGNAGIIAHLISFSGQNKGRNTSAKRSSEKKARFSPGLL